MSFARDDYVRKIRKLVAIAEHDGSDAVQAARAAAMAAELCIKNNIDLDEICSRAGEDEISDIMIGATTITAIRRDREAALVLGDGVQNLFGVQQFEYDLDKKTGIAFAGRPYNVEVASSWMRYLWGAMERASREYVKARQLAPRQTAEAYRSFRYGFVTVVWHRLNDKVKSMSQQGARNETSTANALVVVDWYAKEQQAIQLWAERRIGKVAETAVIDPTITDHHARFAGHKAGRDIGLHDQVAGTDPARLLR